MPLHEYQCKKCGHRFERIQKFTDSPARKCPQCGGALEQLLHAPAVQFKGSGHYARKGGDKAAKEGAAPEAKETTADKTESKTTTEPKKHDKKKK